MIGKIEGVSIELRGTRQYGRAIHCQGADRERFKVEHLPVGSQMFFTVADGDAELAMWVQTGKVWHNRLLGRLQKEGQHGGKESGDTGRKVNQRL